MWLQGFLASKLKLHKTRYIIRSSCCKMFIKEKVTCLYVCTCFIQVNHMRLWIFECRDPSHDAFMLGLIAGVLLVLAHVISNLLGGCMCICSQDEFSKASPNRQLSLACLLFSWYVFDMDLFDYVITMNMCWFIYVM